MTPIRPTSLWRRCSCAEAEPPTGPWDDAKVAADARAFLRATALAALGGLAVTLFSVRFLPGWVGAALGVGQGLVWCGLLLYRQRSRWLLNITVSLIVAGVVELAADAWLVRVTGTLVYPPSGPSLALSPAYMPLAWFGMLSGGSALGVALRKRWSLGPASVAVALALGVYIPIYEMLAAHAGWWHYQGRVLSFGRVPVYIVLGEMLSALPLVVMTERLIHARTLVAAALGVGLGLWIFASYALAWYGLSVI
jgi:hypothetical protein